MVKTIIGLEQYMLNLSDKIKELEELKIKAERIELKRSGECCPDVCQTIDKSIIKLNNELRKAEFDKEKILKLVEIASKVFQTETAGHKTLEKQVIRKASRVEILIREQISSLQNLKQTLSDKNVCKCK